MGRAIQIEHFHDHNIRVALLNGRHESELAKLGQFDGCCCAVGSAQLRRSAIREREIEHDVTPLRVGLSRC
jgi:hypothetical protein